MRSASALASFFRATDWAAADAAEAALDADEVANSDVAATAMVASEGEDSATSYMERPAALFAAAAAEAAEAAEEAAAGARRELREAGGVELLVELLSDAVHRISVEVAEAAAKADVEAAVEAVVTAVEADEVGPAPTAEGAMREGTATNDTAAGLPEEGDDEDDDDDGDRSVACAVASALASAASSDEGTAAAIVEAGGLAPLCSLLSDGVKSNGGDDDPREVRAQVMAAAAAASAIESVATLLPSARDLLREAGAIVPLVGLLDDHEESEEAPQSRVGAEGSDDAVPVILPGSALRAVRDAARDAAAGALKSLAADNADNRRAIRAAGGIEKLVHMLQAA